MKGFKEYISELGGQSHSVVHSQPVVTSPTDYKIVPSNKNKGIETYDIVNTKTGTKKIKSIDSKEEAEIILSKMFGVDQKGQFK